MNVLLFYLAHTYDLGTQDYSHLDRCPFQGHSNYIVGPDTERSSCFRNNQNEDNLQFQKKKF